MVDEEKMKNKLCEVIYSKQSFKEDVIVYILFSETNKRKDKIEGDRERIHLHTKGI